MQVIQEYIFLETKQHSESATTPSLGQIQVHKLLKLLAMSLPQPTWADTPKDTKVSATAHLHISSLVISTCWPFQHMCITLTVFYNTYREKQFGQLIPSCLLVKLWAKRIQDQLGLGFFLLCWWQKYHLCKKPFTGDITEAIFFQTT